MLPLGNKVVRQANTLLYSFNWRVFSPMCCDISGFDPSDFPVFTSSETRIRGAWKHLFVRFCRTVVRERSPVMWRSPRGDARKLADAS